MWISTITSAFVVRAVVQRGELAAAHTLLAALGLTGDLPPTWPHNLVRHARGCLHAAAGDHAAAVGDLLAAGELAKRWGITNPAILPWRSSAALSLKALGDSQEATRLCAEEIESARRWGAGRARCELVVAGGRPRRDATRGRDALTPGEMRVAQLAADGQTNRQIAQALFVTQRTVENHLTSTYAKLQISSRSALPAGLGGSRRADTQPEAP